MKVEVEPVATHSGKFARDDLEDENEELLQIQMQEREILSNGDLEGDYDHIFIQ